MVLAGRDGVDGAAPVELLTELHRFAAVLRDVGLNSDDELLVEVAFDLTALVARHAIEALGGRAA